MVFRATRNLCYGIKSNKEIQSKSNLSNKEIHDPVSGANILETFDLSKASWPKLKKLKLYLNKRIDWEHILEYKCFSSRYL